MGILYKKSLSTPFESCFLILNNWNNFLQTHINSITIYYQNQGLRSILKDFNLKSYLHIRFGVALNLSAQKFTRYNMNF